MQSEPEETGFSARRSGSSTPDFLSEGAGGSSRPARERTLGVGFNILFNRARKSDEGRSEGIRSMRLSSNVPVNKHPNI